MQPSITQTMCIWYSNAVATKHGVKTHKHVMHAYVYPTQCLQYMSCESRYIESCQARSGYTIKLALP